MWMPCTQLSVSLCVSTKLQEHAHENIQIKHLSIKKIRSRSLFCLCSSTCSFYYYDSVVQYEVWYGRTTNIIFLCVMVFCMNAISVCHVYAWWCMPLISRTQEAEEDETLWDQSQRGLHIKFQVNQGCIVRSCLKNTKTKDYKLKMKKETSQQILMKFNSKMYFKIIT